MKYLDIKIMDAERWKTERPTAARPLKIDASRIAERMTPRELDVLSRMAVGLSNRAIAADLGIEYTTVRGHVQAVLEKLGARSRFDAVARAYRTGLVRDAENER
jgi:DNA-binding NarL/FixJ family response regulator